MKIWLRYGIGVVLGIILGLWLPTTGGDTVAVLETLSELVIRVARVFLFPMVFFAAIIATDELNEDRQLFRLGGEAVGWTLLAMVLSAIVGITAIIGLEPQRIPPMIQEGNEIAALQFLEVLREGVPLNFFSFFVLGENALLAVLVLGVIIGIALRYDREITSPLSLVIDSANRISYYLNGILVGIIGFLLAIPSAMVIVRLRSAETIALFGQLILVVAVAAIVVAFVLYPLVLYLLDRRGTRPLRWLAVMIPTALVAAAGGDTYLALATTARVAKENLGVPRRIGGTVTPIVAIFGRAGTVLVTIAGFLLVIRSYTALEIGFGEIIGLSITAIGYSFLMVRVPSGGVIMLLSYVALRYGRGMENSYLILLPVMLVLERIAVVLDAMTVGFVTQVIAIRYGYVREVDRPV